MPTEPEVIDLCSDSEASDGYTTDDYLAAFRANQIREREAELARLRQPAKTKAKATTSRATTTKTTKREKTEAKDVKKEVKKEVKLEVKQEFRWKHLEAASASASASESVQAAMPPPGPMSRMDVLLAGLNKAQHSAVTSCSATVAILAGPGSGKTHTLTSRIVWMLDHVGYRPQDVIVATFTNKAAREMKERVGKFLGDGRERRLVLGTFHSVARRYLMTYGKHIGLDPKFTIIDESDKSAILKRICEQLKLTNLRGSAGAWISKKKARGPAGELEDQKKREQQQQQRQSRFGSHLAPESNTEQAELATIYGAYQQYLEEMSFVDFDDLLVKCTELLRKMPRCVRNVQAVLVDEYQDTNGIQFELMKLLGQAKNRITVVGDPDQSIYGWRSAETTNLSRFLAEYPGTAEVSLEENYRSSQRILDTALQVIEQDDARYKKSLLPVHKKGTRPVLRVLADAHEEAAWIVQEIERVRHLSGHMVTHQDVAILLRSASLSRPIESKLGMSGIPYRMLGGLKFFDRREIKLLMDYLRVIYRPDNNEALLRVINVPRRGIGDRTVEDMLDGANEENGRTLWQYLNTTFLTRYEATKKKKNLRQFVDMINSFRGMHRFLEKENQSQGRSESQGQSESQGRSESQGQSQADSQAESQTGSQSQGQDDHDVGSTPVDPATLTELVEALMEKLNYDAYVKDAFAGDEEARRNNIREFVGLVGQFASQIEDESLPLLDDTEQTHETSVLGRFLANVALSSDADTKDKAEQAEKEKEKKNKKGGKNKKDENESKTKPTVTISTIHAAKGLEWPMVFVPSACNGMLPHVRAEDVDEERRLLYVAMTRAQCLLNVSYGATRSQAQGGGRDRDGGDREQAMENELSDFLAPISTTAFVDKGPSYDRPLLEEMGDILGRPVPSNKAIYEALPDNFETEDDRFPTVPEGRDGDDRDRMAKRRRMQYDMSSGGVYGQSYQRGYRTTMEGSSDFSLPGFTTATEHFHKYQLDGKTPYRPVPLPRTSNLPPGQQTILQSFQTTANKHSHDNNNNNDPDVVELMQPSVRVIGPSSSCAANNLPRILGYHPAAPIQPVVDRQNTAIPSEFKNHKIGGGVLPKMKMNHLRTHDHRNRNNTKRYAHFSSSPTRPEKKEKVEKIEKTAKMEKIEPKDEKPKGYPNHLQQFRQWQGKENLRTVPPRPTSMHATTMAQIGQGGQGGPYGRRPMGGGITPMDKLKQPFKPPSMKRP